MAADNRSEQLWSLDDVFEHRPKLRALFELLRADLEGFGPVEMVVTRTRVSFGAKRKFALLWPSQSRGSSPEGTLLMTLELTEPHQHPLVVAVQETFPGKWTHRFAVTDQGVVEQIRKLGWLADAHRFGTMDRARTRRD